MAEKEELLNSICQYLIPSAYQKDTPVRTRAEDIANHLWSLGYRKVDEQKLREGIDKILEPPKGNYKAARGCAPRPPGAPIAEDAIARGRGVIGEPPVLSDEEIEKLQKENPLLDFSMMDDYRAEVKLLLKAQRDLCVRHYNAK